ncbi:peptidase C39 family protein [Herbihabitans rhizosphaerae]
MLGFTLIAVPASAAPTVGAAADAPVNYREWRTPQDFAAGENEGVRPGHYGGVTLDKPIGTIDHTEPGQPARKYEYSRWTSPFHKQGFDATQLVASWNAVTPPKSFITVEMRGKLAGGGNTTWYTMGRWAHEDTDIKRTSIPGQDDAHGLVDVDTFKVKSGVALHGFQLRATLYREAGDSNAPTVNMVGAMTSNIPDRFTVPASKPGVAAGIELRVPRYSQNVHVGHYPEYGGGGEAWCSPTSTEMVIEYFGKRPSDPEMAWIPADHVDRTVDHAARYTFDKDYDGTGNWPFNTAYAWRFQLPSHITRLSTLNDLERYIAAGIPVITSQSFYAKELDGAGYGTAGHLMVVIGFTKEGDVIANDPASKNNDAVRRVYKRAQFENIWLRTKRYTEDGKVASGPGGIAYIIAGKPEPR